MSPRKKKKEYEDDDGSGFGIHEIAEIWASHGKDEDYTYGYSEEELERALHEWYLLTKKTEDLLKVLYLYEFMVSVFISVQRIPGFVCDVFCYAVAQQVYIILTIEAFLIPVKLFVHDMNDAILRVQQANQSVHLVICVQILSSFHQIVHYKYHLH